MHVGHRYSTSAAIGRSGGRVGGAETGSSGEASTAAGDKHACSAFLALPSPSFNLS
jgi:hypothetical protein